MLLSMRFRHIISLPAFKTIHGAKFTNAVNFFQKNLRITKQSEKRHGFDKTLQRRHSLTDIFRRRRGIFIQLNIKIKIKNDQKTGP